MNNYLITKYRLLILVVALLASPLINGQQKFDKNFKVNKNAVIDLDISHAELRLETWDKNTVSIEAFIEGKKLDEKNLQKLLDQWNFSVTANKNRIEVRSKSKNKRYPFVYGNDISVFNSDSIAKSLDFIGPLIYNIVRPLTQSFSKYPHMEEFTNKMGPLKFDHEAYKKNSKAYMKQWEKKVKDAFGDEDHEKVDAWKKNTKDGFFDFSLNFKDGFFEIPKFPFGSYGSINFDSKAYKRNKKAYVDKLNRKHDTHVSIKEVDKWLEDMDVWETNFEKKWEKWGDDFGKKMKVWGESFGKKMNLNAKKLEESIKGFDKKIESWSENFEKNMEESIKGFDKKIESWAENFADKFDEDYTYSRNNKHNKNHSYGSIDIHPNTLSKIIIIKVPNSIIADVKIRYGILNMSSVNNIKANLAYSRLTAKRISGDQTSIKASYTPVKIENWEAGNLELRYSDDCVIKNANQLNLSANSADVKIGTLTGDAVINGSFGELLIEKMASTFSNLDVMLENTNALLKLPKNAFTLYYNGQRSHFNYPSSLKVREIKNGNNIIVKGYNQNNNSNKIITISAKFSDVVIQ